MLAPLSVLANRIADYESRFQYEWSPYLPRATRLANRPKVLVVGYGYGSSAFTECLDHTKYDTTILSASPNRLNQPFLIQAIANKAPARLYKYAPYRVQFREDTCVLINQAIQTVHGKQTVYPYDYLVLATGSEVNDFNVKGVKEHCLFLKTKRDLDLVNAKLRQMPPTSSVIVLGAGPTGIELACKMRSMNYPVTIVEASPAILPGFSQPFRDRVMTLLDHKGIQIRLNMPVSSIDSTTIQSAKTGQTLPYKSTTDLLLWTCGVKPTPFGLPYKPDQHLSVSPSIYVLGDASRQGPPTAQNAKQQGQYLAQVFNSNFTNPPPYQYKELGKVLDTTDGYLVEFKGFVVYVPYFLRPLVDFFRE
jgi:NADH dehydrogenase FAD-containing subunit